MRYDCIWVEIKMKILLALLLICNTFACDAEPEHYICDQHGDLIFLFRKDAPQYEYRQPLWLCDNCACNSQGPNGPTGPR
jgi:hypothetical protein